MKKVGLFFIDDNQYLEIEHKDNNMESARIIIEVVAGVIPGTPIPKYTRKFGITSDAWYMQGKFENKPKEAQDEIMQTYGMAYEYMRSLYNPQNVNWVRCDWIYL